MGAADQTQRHAFNERITRPGTKIKHVTCTDLAYNTLNKLRTSLQVLKLAEMALDLKSRVSDRTYTTTRETTQQAETADMLIEYIYLLCGRCRLVRLVRHKHDSRPLCPYKKVGVPAVDAAADEIIGEAIFRTLPERQMNVLLCNTRAISCTCLSQLRKVTLACAAFFPLHS